MRKTCRSRNKAQIVVLKRQKIFRFIFFISESCQHLTALAENSGPLKARFPPAAILEWNGWQNRPA